jgi:protein-S-isoprenylcysteine O-methyltransferase Ste14
MPTFLVLLLIGFASNLLSAFTSAFSLKWGRRAGRVLTVLLRDISGIPVWATGFAVAASIASPPLIEPGGISLVIAWCLIAAGGLIIIVALVPLGWRAVAPSAGDTLVDRGPYRYVRHPIHAGALLEFIGLALSRPTVPVLSACGIGVVWLGLQSRLEELDLLRRMPGYREYRQRVPAFLPRRGRRRHEGSTRR